MVRTGVFSATFAALLFVFSVTGSSIAPAPPAEASEQTITVHWGNWTVNAGQQWTQTFFNVSPKPCSDCYITSVLPDLEYDTTGPGDGPGPWATADYSNGAMLHHMVLGNGGRQDPTCGPNGAGLLGDRFYASGNERGHLTLPAGYGYYLQPGGAWFMNLNVMIHNLSIVTNKTFRLAMTFTYHPAADNLKSLTSLWLDENNCLTSEYPVCEEVGAGCYDDAHWDWTPGSVAGQTYDDVEGKVLLIGGHVHDLGISVAAEKLQTGEWVCAAVGAYAQGSVFDPPAAASPPRPDNGGHPADAIANNPGDPDYNGHIESMTGCANPGTIIAPGTTIRLHTQYNPSTSSCDGDPADGCLDDVMGIMGAWIYDNCAGLSNPQQADVDNDDLGDLCDPDVDGDSILNGNEAPDADADGDGLKSELETACGSNHLHSVSTPERVDLSGDEDLDGQTNETQAPVGSDCDGDGYTGTTENSIFSGPPQQTARDQDPCGADGWPLELSSITFPINSANKINLPDLSSFLSPRRLNTSPGDLYYSVRHDIVPGLTVPFPKYINLADLQSLTLSLPPMFGGQTRAMNGPVCPWAP